MPLMKIYQLEAGMINVSIIAKVKDQVFENGKYKTILGDETGEISMLFSEKIPVGTVMKIERAYVYRYRGKLCITPTKKGKISRY